jgi:hypothetical protein
MDPHRAESLHLKWSLPVWTPPSGGTPFGPGQSTHWLQWRQAPVEPLWVAALPPPTMKQLPVLLLLRVPRAGWLDWAIRLSVQVRRRRGAPKPTSFGGKAFETPPWWCRPPPPRAAFGSIRRPGLSCWLRVGWASISAHVNALRPAIQSKSKASTTYRCSECVLAEVKEDRKRSTHTVFVCEGWCC